MFSKKVNLCGISRKILLFGKPNKQVFFKSILWLICVSIGGPSYAAGSLPVELGSAKGFGVLGGAAVTSAGATVVSGGDVGTSPGSSVTGFPPGTVTSPNTIEAGTALAAQAHSDLNTAYNDAASRAVNRNLTGQDLGGQTLDPGTYFFASSAQLTGTLTLDDQGDPNAVFIFQIGSTLITASDSTVVTIDGSSDVGADVFWQVGSSATLGVGTSFEGNILADQSITLDPGASDFGRLLALNGAVTLNNNLVQVPAGALGAGVPDESLTLLLLAATVAGLFMLKTGLAVHAIPVR